MASSTNVLSEKDANNSLQMTGDGTAAAGKGEIKSMEYHRQMLKSKMEEEKYGRTKTNTHTTTSSSGPGTGTANTTAAAAKKPMMMINNRPLTGLPADPRSSSGSASQQYISPSDGIMSPCTAKLTALKGRHAGKAKPKSLFAQASARKFDSENVLGARNAAAQNPPSSTEEDA
ncbi:hypothetical protein F5Y17DRAFT_411334 [Xylariaceae sp. FL0594]|nr:hypothetical protein F5Y17DRAFT_411334 [Xylariaceae sp. FL0594]